MNKIYLSLYVITILSLLMPLSINQYANAQIIGGVLGPPTNLVANAVSSSEIDLSWTAPSDLGGSLIIGYKIERSTNSGSTWSTIVPNTGSTGTTYSDFGLAHSTTYTYRVSAITLLVTSQPSNTASARTFSVVSSPPTGLTATAISSSQINLSWTAPADNGGSPITGYEIDRSTDGGSTWSTIVSNSASTSITYSDTGLSPSTAYTYRVSAINSVGTSQPSNTASATTNQQFSIKLVKSGLVDSDPLNNETKTQQQLQANSGYWFYGGDAPARGAKYDFFRDTLGLHIGVQSPVDGIWAGLYAEGPHTNAMLFHAVIETPVRTIPAKWYENALYVQTSQPKINYITCISITQASGTYWEVGSTFGDANNAINFTTYWIDTSPNVPLKRDCTIITNGQNYLKVYIDGVMVYSSSTLDLQMPAPFNVYLEPQTAYSGQLLNGTYTDYYATTDENIQVTNLPNNAARVDIVDASGNVLLDTGQVSSGIAVLDVGKYHFPLAANINVYDSNNVLIASTSSITSIYGGDIYSTG